MVDYSYDRDDIYPPDFRDDYRERYYDRSKIENDYIEYFRDQRKTDRKNKYESNSRNYLLTSTRSMWGYGNGSQDQQVDQNDDDMSQLQNIGSNRPNPFNFYRVRSNRNYWF